MDFHYLYNVQPRPRKEFGVNAKATHRFDDEWTLIEWHVDYATQTYQCFVNGEELTDLALHKGAGRFEGAELPAAFQTLSIGWTNYQPATGAGFTVWIDDLAIGKKRLGPVALPVSSVKGGLKNECRPDLAWKAATARGIGWGYPQRGYPHPSQRGGRGISRTKQARRHFSNLPKVDVARPPPPSTIQAVYAGGGGA